MRGKRDQTLTFIGTAIVAVALLFANADGYHNEWSLDSNRRSFGDLSAEPPNINWTHGWPIRFVVRHGIYSVDAGKGVLVMSFSGGHGLYSRWPVDSAPLTHFQSGWLALDIVVCFTILAGATRGLTILTHRIRWRLQFGVKHLFALLTVVSVGLALRQQLFPSRFVLQYAAFAVIAAGIMLSVLACLDAAWRLGRLVRRPSDQ